MALMPVMDEETALLRANLLSMIHAIDRILAPQPDGKLTDLDADRLAQAVAFLDDQLPINTIQLEKMEQVIAAAEPESRSSLGRLYDLEIDKVLASCKGLEKYRKCAPDLQGQAFHLVVGLDAYAERLKHDLNQTIIPKEDLKILRRILKGIQRALGV